MKKVSEQRKKKTMKRIKKDKINSQEKQKQNMKK